MGCVSPDSHPRKSVLRKERKLRSNYAGRFSKSTWHHVKVRDKRSHKCEPHERSPKFEERSQEETLHQERCARRAAWDLAKIII